MWICGGWSSARPPHSGLGPRVVRRRLCSSGAVSPACDVEPVRRAGERAPLDRRPSGGARRRGVHGGGRRQQPGREGVHHLPPGDGGASKRDAYLGAHHGGQRTHGRAGPHRRHAGRRARRCRAGDAGGLRRPAPRGDSQMQRPAASSPARSADVVGSKHSMGRAAAAVRQNGSGSRGGRLGAGLRHRWRRLRLRPQR